MSSKDLMTLTVITDFEVPMYHMGEVDFRYSTEELIEHIEKYGADELLNMLGFLQHVVWEAKLSLTQGSPPGFDNTAQNEPTPGTDRTG